MTTIPLELRRYTAIEKAGGGRKSEMIYPVIFLILRVGFHPRHAGGRIATSADHFPMLQPGHVRQPIAPVQ